MDLLEGLADHLKTLDLSDQRRLMLTKFSLLKPAGALDNYSNVAYKEVAKALRDGACFVFLNRPPACEQLTQLYSDRVMYVSSS